MDGGSAEVELGHAPDDIGHYGGDHPGPAESGGKVSVDEPKGSFLSREGDVGDGREHYDAADHRERLQPEEPEACDYTQVEGSGERAAAEGDGTLEPTRTG